MNDTLDNKAFAKGKGGSKKTPAQKKPAIIKDNPVIKDGGDFPFSPVLSIPLQTFTISPFEHIILEGQRGVKIHIKADSFVYMSGIPVKEPIEVELKEVYLKSGMVRENLTTTSEGRILESGGMIYLNATSYDENVRIRPDQPIHIEMPRSQNGLLPGMNIFNGQRYGSEAPINWTLNPERRLHRQANPKSILRKRPFRSFRNQKGTSLARGLNKYLFETKRLGWMNCDRFLREEKETTALTIIEGVDATIEMKVVLKDYNSTLPVFKKEGKYIAPMVPVGEKIFIVGLGQVGEEMYLAIKETIVEKDHKESLEFKLETPENIRKRLKVINS